MKRGFSNLSDGVEEFEVRKGPSLTRGAQKKRDEEEAAIRRVIQKAKEQGTYRGPDWDGQDESDVKKG